MRLCLIISVLLLTGCGREAPVPKELLVLPQGYEGPTPKTESQIVKAIIADRRAQDQCFAQLDSVRTLLYP